MRTIERSILDKRLCARKIKDRIIKCMEAAERPSKSFLWLQRRNALSMGTIGLYGMFAFYVLFDIYKMTSQLQ